MSFVNVWHIADAVADVSVEDVLASEIHEQLKEEHAKRDQVDNDFCLISRLPPTSRLEEDAKRVAKQNYSEWKKKRNLHDALTEEIDLPEAGAQDEQEVNKRIISSRRRSSSSSNKDQRRHSQSSDSSSPTINKGKNTIRTTPIQPYELLRAIEKKDLQLIFQVRDTQFNLLVQQKQGVTPLLYSMRLGPEYKSISILLTGALSRFVNQLPETEAPDRATRETLRQVRANLKWAITQSLETSQTDLISSYLQVLVMSEGERWVLEQAHQISLSIRSGPNSNPVENSRQSVMRFATAELKTLNKTDLIASVQDYISNACLDLLMMGAWKTVNEYVRLSGSDNENLPPYQFGRDDRMYKTFVERISIATKTREYDKVPKLVRQTIKNLIEIIGKHHFSLSQKVDELQQVLDSKR